MTLTMYKPINYDYIPQNSLILNYTPKIIMVQDKLSYSHCDKGTERATNPYTG